jgi:hypothetical protein
LSQNDPRFAEVAAQRIDELRPLAHKALIGAERHSPSLVLCTLNLDIAHVRTQRGLRDCGCIGCVILLAFNEWLYIN